MSIPALQWAFECDVKGPAKAVLLVLADHADEAGECWPGQERIAQRAGVSVRTVRNAVDDLVAAGVVALEEIVGVRTTYRLSLVTPARHAAPERDAAPAPRAATPAPDAALPRNVVPLTPAPRAAEPSITPIEPKRTPKELRGSRLADDWRPSPDDRRFAEGMGLDAEAVGAKFADYWHGVAGAKARKTDWPATWRNWCRSEAANPKNRAPLFARPSDADREAHRKFLKEMQA